MKSVILQHLLECVFARLASFLSPLDSYFYAQDTVNSVFIHI